MFRFEEIGGLYFLIGLPLLAVFIWLMYIVRKKQISKFGDLNLLDRLTPASSRNLYWIKKGFLLLSITMMCIAWSNPQWGTKKEKVKAQSADIFIALDISNSMMAKDISPNRLERSKKFTLKLLQSLRGNRIGLIFFAGGAYLQMPLSDDYAAAELFVRSANTNQAGTQGTAIDEAIGLAGKAFDEESNHQKAIIIISDGEDHDNAAIQAAEAGVENGLVTYTIAVGTEDGAFIPVMNRGREEYKKDENGSPVKSKINIANMQSVAQSGGGKFYVINQGQEAIDDLKTELDKLEKREVEQKSFSEYNSYFQYFLFIALLFLVLEYLLSSRKKALKPIMAIGLLVLGNTTLVGQSAHQHLRSGDTWYEKGAYTDAEEAYRKANQEKASAQASYNLGNTLYNQERMEEAIQSYQSAVNKAKDEAEKGMAYHNLGNAYFNAQQFQESLDAYKNALKMNPNDADTKENLLAAKQMLRIQQQQQQQQQPSNQEQEEEQNEEEQQEQEQQEQNINNNQEEEQKENTSESKQDLNKEDARKLLEIIDEEERKVQEKLRKQDSKKKPTKDW